MIPSPQFLTAVVNTILPGLPTSKTAAALPPASGVGVVQSLSQHLNDHPQKELFTEALQAIMNTADGADNFIEAEEEDATAILHRVAQSHSKAFEALVFIVSADYYETAAVLNAFGWRVTPPQPLGYPLPPFDEQLLKPVKRRPPLWRKTAP